MTTNIPFSHEPEKTMTNEQLREAYQIQRDNNIWPYMKEILKRSETDFNVIRSYLGFFDMPTLRWRTVNLVTQINDPMLIPVLDRMIFKLFEFEDAGEDTCESQRMGIYEALAKSTENKALVTDILLRALKREEWINNVLDALIDALVAMGPEMVPTLKENLRWCYSKPPRRVSTGPGKSEISGLERALLKMGMTKIELDALKPPETNNKRGFRLF